MKKKLAVMGLVSIMTMSMVACGKDEKKAVMKRHQLL